MNPAGAKQTGSKGVKRIKRHVLLEAGLELMRLNGKPLTKLPTKDGSMRYELPSGETVRPRPSNDRKLIAVADKPSAGARLDIEDTDWLFIVMPEIARTEGKIVAYLIPAEKAAAEVRQAHQAWLASANTKGGQHHVGHLVRPRRPARSNGYAQKRAEYQLEGEVSTFGFLEQATYTHQ